VRVHFQGPNADPGKVFLESLLPRGRFGWIQNWKIMTRLYPDPVVTQRKTGNVVLRQFVTDW